MLQPALDDVQTTSLLKFFCIDCHKYSIILFC